MDSLFKGLMLFDIKTFHDHRGYFRETFRLNNPAIAETGVEFVQDNESLSKQVYVLRGLHFQRPPHAQAKLVRVVSGSAYDVVVDLRPSSETFGQWQGFELNADNGQQLFVPAGFAHGFCTLEENTVVSYKVSDYYAPDCDGGLRWDDPDLNINWPLNGKNPVVSEKDSALPVFADIDFKSFGW